MKDVIVNMDKKIAYHYTDLTGKLQTRTFDKKRYCIGSNAKIEHQILASHFEKEQFEWDRLDEIKKILDAGLLHSALILALLLPDICSKIDYPEMKETKNGDRYARWFNENIYGYNLGTVGKNGDKFDCFNGYMCYFLRCRMIHGDSIDIEDIPNRKQSSFRKNGYVHIYFEFTSNSYSEFFSFDGSKKIGVFYKSLPQLVMQIISCADACYKETDDKSRFFDGCRFQEYTL